MGRLDVVAAEALRLLLDVAEDAPLGACTVTITPRPADPIDTTLTVLQSVEQQTALIAETIFEHRFMHVGELKRMGADVRIDGHTAVVVGPTKLAGAQVMATDLRASACLVLAGLVAEGVTVIDRVYHLDRGYEPMELKLQAVGASVERIR